ncbi:MAG: thermonuclease family protein [Thermomicrobiales bacterium]
MTGLVKLDEMPTREDFTNALFHYKATVTRIIDGDTCEVEISLGCRVYTVRRIRLLGYNAPELFSGDDRGSGADAKAALEAIIPIGSTVYIATQLDHTSFERLLAWTYAPGSGDELLDVAAAMIAGGFITPSLSTGTGTTKGIQHMPKNEKATSNAGQQKQHVVRDKDGVESSVTQEEWRNRDKSAGLERVDDVETADDTATETPVVESPA